MPVIPLAGDNEAVVTERRDTDLDPWLTQAQQSGIVELGSFAQEIRDDTQRYVLPSLLCGSGGATACSGTSG